MGINAIVGQSGGPTCVINSSLAGVFSACRKHGVQHRLRVAGLRLGVILPVLLLTAAADHAVAQLLEGSQRGKCDEQKEQQTLNGLRRHFSERR